MRSYRPMTPKTKKNRVEMSITFISFGMEAIREFTTNFIPSFFDTNFRGLKALSALKALTKLISKLAERDGFDSITQLTIEKSTIVKSRTL